MSKGLKRNVKYISLLQLQYMGRGIIFGLIYGLLLGYWMEDGAGEVMRTMLRYFAMILFIMTLSLQMRYIRWMAGFSCSMGCLRKNIVAGQHIMNLEVFAEILFLVSAARLAVGVKWERGAGEIVFFSSVIVMLMAIGMFCGLLTDKIGTWGFIVAAVLFGVVYSMVFVGGLEMEKMNPIGKMIEFFHSAGGIALVVLLSVLLYGIAGFLSAGKFRKMEVIV